MRFFNKLDWRNSLIIFFLYAFLSFIFYFSSLFDYFVSDDFLILNEVSKHGFSVIFWYFPADYPHFFRPLSISIYKLIYTSFGLNPFCFKLFNLLVHIFNCFLVFYFVRQLLCLKADLNEKNKISIAFFAGILFSILYIHAEPVIFISCLSDTVYTFFYLLASIFFIKNKLSSCRIYFILIHALFIFSLLAKELAISFLLFVIAADYIIFKTPLLRITKSNFSIFAVGMIYLLGRLILFPKMVNGELYSEINIIFEFFKNTIFTYTALLFSLDFMSIKEFLKSSPQPLYMSVINTAVKFPIAVLAVISSIILNIFFIKGKDRIVVFLSVFIFAAVLPTLWIAGFERYLYLPSAAFVSLISIYIFGLKNKIFKIAVFSILIIYNMICLSEKIKNWNSAALISRNIVADLNREKINMPDSAEVLFLNLPDNYRGAWIFRNGIDYIPHLLLKRDDLKFKRIFDDSKIEFNSNTIIYEFINNKFKIIYR